MSPSDRKGASRVSVMVGATLLILALSLALAACGSSASSATTTTGVPTTGGVTTTGGGSGNTTVNVDMVNRAFDPQTVTVKVGDTVTWTNQDSLQHNVVAGNGEFKSGLFGKGGTFSFTFTAAGTYPYTCTVHAGMNGTVIVK